LGKVLASPTGRARLWRNCRLAQPTSWIVTKIIK